MSESWIIRERQTGLVVCETFNPKFVAALNAVKYEAVPAARYLGELNKSIKEGRHG